VRRFTVKEFGTMSSVCEICGKKPGFGCKVSNSQRHTKRRWMPNLQPVRAQTEHGNRRMRVCTSCLKAGKVRRAV
jgi:large subunit ribosomal protein L28